MPLGFALTCRVLPHLVGRRPLLPLLLAGFLGSGGCSNKPPEAAESSTSGASGTASSGANDGGPSTSTAAADSSGNGSASSSSSSSSSSGSPAETAPGTDSGESSSTGSPPDPPTLPLCGTAPPPGATLAPELPTFGGGGMCPVLETNGTLNVMNSGGGDREFMVVVPDDWEQGEQLPVIVLYHWLGASAASFYDRAEVQAAADHYRFIALIPEGRELEDLVPFRWPFAVSDLDLLMDQDFQFLDDMLACAHAQFGIDKECVSVMGVSAGAMFSSMIASRHSSRIASLISLSGGVGGLIKPWQAGGHVMPAMVLWGGRQDFCIAIDFEVASLQLEQDLEANGHFVVECIHNCAHATPPFEPDEAGLPTFAPAWEFFLDHPYWLEDGESPYQSLPEGLPDSWPQWCSIGAGNADIRVGECGGSECQ